MAPNNRDVIQKTLEGTDLPSRKCPICGEGNFAISNTLHLAGSVDVSDHGVDPVRGILLVAVICQKCGNVQFYSPKQMGAI